MSTHIGKYLIYGGGEQAPDGQGGYVTVPSGVFSMIQLWNPANSGKNCLIDSLGMFNGLKHSDFLLYFTQTPFSSYKGKWWTMTPPQANGVLEFRAAISATHVHPYPDESNTNIFFQWWFPPSGALIKPFALTIPPGWGLNFEHSVQDNAMMVNADGREEVV